MNKEIQIGKAIVEIDDRGNLIVGRLGETKLFFREDDGVPGKLYVECENGHTGMSIEIPAMLASATGKAFAVENPCPYCGGKLAAPGGYYVRNDEGVFVKLSGMPS